MHLLALSRRVLPMLLLLPPGAHPQQPPAKGIPLERCDRLPIAVVQVAGMRKRFLVDTAATSILNVNSFPKGISREIEVSSWSGTAATSAVEVRIPELTLGGKTVRDLRLPAVDLSTIGQACGGRIDGILGLDLIERLGVTIDLANRVARLPADEEDRQRQLNHLLALVRICLDAFSRGDRRALGACVAPEIVLFTPWGEVRGREQMLDYLEKRFFARPARMEMNIDPANVRIAGDTVWFSYEYTITLPDQVVRARGMAFGQVLSGRWQLVSMHNSFAGSDAKATSSND